MQSLDLESQSFEQVLLLVTHSRLAAFFVALSWLARFLVCVSGFLAKLEVVLENVESIVVVVGIEHFLLVFLQIAFVSRLHSHGGSDYEECVVEGDLHRVCGAFWKHPRHEVEFDFEDSDCACFERKGKSQWLHQLLCLVRFYVYTIEFDCPCTQSDMIKV